MPAEQAPGFRRKVGEFYVQHWRIMWASFCLVEPFTTIGDPEFYMADSTLVNVAKFVAILVVSWVAGTVFFRLHRSRQRAILRAATDDKTD